MHRARGVALSVLDYLNPGYELRSLRRGRRGRNGNGCRGRALAGHFLKRAPVGRRAAQGGLEGGQIGCHQGTAAGISEHYDILCGPDVGWQLARPESQIADYGPNNKADETNNDEGCIVLHNRRF